jgi:hypothetical protein
VRPIPLAAHLFVDFLNVSLPEHLAAQINTICEKNGLSYSDFFCEATFAYLAAKSRAQQYLAPTYEDDIISDPFHIFCEWDSKEDCVYDILR